MVRVADSMSGRSYRQRQRFVNALIYVFILAIVLFTLLPFVWPFLSAFGEKPENVSGIYAYWPQRFTLEHFERAFDPTAGGAAVALRNSLVVSAGAVFIVLVVCTFAGYTLSRLNFRGKRGLMYSLLLLQVVPGTATVLPLFLIMRDLGLVNKLGGVMLGLATGQVPFTTWVMKGFFDSVPKELEEAAWLDGAGMFKTLFTVMLPLALPGLGSAAVLGFNAVWGSFFLPMIMLSSQDKFVMPLALFRSIIAYTNLDYGMMNAMGLVYMLPSLMFFMFARKYLIQGTMAGAMAGQ